MNSNFLKPYIKPMVAYILALFICVITLAWVMKLWEADFSIPFSYEGDALNLDMLIKSIIDNGWIYYNDFVGMPTGLYMYDYPVADNLTFGLIKIITFFAHNYANAMNFFYLLTFPLTTFTTMLVLRQFKVSYASSIVFSLLFTFVPYHFLRGEPHVHIANYFIIPPMVMVIIWIYTDKIFFSNSNKDEVDLKINIFNRKSIMSILICFIVSSSFIYYSLFSCFFLMVAGITSSISRKNKYPLLESIVLIASILIGVIINILPSLIFIFNHGRNAEAIARTPFIEAELYGLKIIQLLMPIPGHRIPFLAHIADIYFRSAPLVTENYMSSLGIIGSVGFIILILYIFYKSANGINNVPLISELSILNLSAILLATIGGFANIVNLIFPAVRAYNRMSIFIAFFSFFAVAILLDYFSKKYVKTKAPILLFYGLMALILVGGILDQTSDSFAPPYSTTKAEYISDQNFMDGIQAVMPENAMIFQLPYAWYPEYPPINRMTDYSHFKGYLHSKDLRWSYGTIKGRAGDLWQREVATLPLTDMVKILSITGFNGIYVDSYGYPDNGISIIANLSNLLDTEPLISANGRLFFFDMTEYNRKFGSNLGNEALGVPIFGWFGYKNLKESIRLTHDDWMIQDDTTFLVYSLENRTANLSLKALSFYRNRTLEVYANDDLMARISLLPTGFSNVIVPVHLVKGSNVVRFHVPEGCERPRDKPELNNPDERCLSVAIQDIILSEIKSARQLDYVSGFYDVEDWLGTPTRWMQSNATLLVNSPENRTANLSLNAQSFFRNRTLEVTSGSVLAAQAAVPTSFINVSVPIHLEKGANTVYLHVPEGCERPSNIKELNSSDERCISVAVQNLRVI